MDEDSTRFEPRNTKAAAISANQQSPQQLTTLKYTLLLRTLEEKIENEHPDTPFFI
jgi:hypothetical protein